MRFNESILSDDLIHPQYRRPDCKVAGACYIVSEAAYHLGLKEQGFFPVRVKLYGVTHWWLENVQGDRVDYTATQFTLDRLSEYYNAGRPGGFLTKEPSRRARIVMARWLQYLET